MTLIIKLELLFKPISEDKITGFPTETEKRPSRYVEFNGICEI
jgi:hypothetical protein